jgi:O-methyltransferase
LFRLRVITRLLRRSPRTKQFIALEKYRLNPRKLPGDCFSLEDMLFLPAKEVARALTLGVMYINTADVKGDVAEFGTMSGLTARVSASAMVYDPERQPSCPLRCLRLFDSFEGLPDITSGVDRSSPHVISGDWAKGGCKLLSAGELHALMASILPPERIEINVGWFSETASALPPTTRFAMIHFDGDLYQSMIDALTPCFERGLVSRGAVLCFDDWNCNQADPAYGERRAWAELVDKFVIVASNCDGYGSIGTKFIVHSYRGMPPPD